MSRSLVLVGNGSISSIQSKRFELLTYLKCEAELAIMRHKSKRATKYLHFMNDCRAADNAIIAQWYAQYNDLLSSVETSTTATNDQHLQIVPVSPDQLKLF